MSILVCLKQWPDQQLAISTQSLLDIKGSKSINQNFVKNVKKAGLRLFVWTINNSEEAKKFFKLGVDGITTDRPFWLKQSLKINS